MFNWKSTRFQLVLLAAAILALSLILSPSAGTAPAQARADPLTINEREPFDTVVDNSESCLREAVHIRGTIHLVFHVVFFSNDDVRLSLSHIAMTGTGVGLTTGVKYRVSGSSQATFTSSPLRFEYTVAGHQYFIGQGRAPNFYFQFVGHTTVTPKGEVKSEFYKYRITCRPEAPYPPPGTPTPTFEPYPPPGTPTPTFDPYPPPGTPTPTFDPYPPPGTPTPTFDPYPPPGTH